MMADMMNTPPKACTYTVRFWLEGIGYARQERMAANAVDAGLKALEELTRIMPRARVVVISITRK